MSSANERTIATYNGGVQAYIDGTPQTLTGNQKRWLDTAFETVKKDAKILEIGSAFGRDFQYLTERGFMIDASDATSSFVEYLRVRGIDAQQLNIVNEVPKKRYDVIFASAVFLHFTQEDFDKAVTHVYDALEEHGKFIFSVKRGEGEMWSTAKMGAERYFKYWQRDTVAKSLGALGFAMDNDATFVDDGWVYGVTQKQEKNESSY